MIDKRHPAMKKHKPVEHYLITIDLCPLPARMHSYVMTNDRQVLEGVWNKMFDIIEKQGLRIMLPMVLQTTLTSGADIVREIIGRESPETKHTFEAATDFHCSIFMMQADCADDKVLMDLH